MRSQPWLLACVFSVLGWVTAVAQPPDVYSLYRHSDAPGAIALRQRWSRPGLQGYFQPVSVRVPDGVSVAIATEGGFSPLSGGAATFGIMAGYPYRLHIHWTVRQKQLDVYPTIELIDRLYSPDLQQLSRFPIVVEFTTDDLELAVAGNLVSKVVYVQDPDLPSLGATAGQQPWFDVLPDEDPLEVADELGRPLAIVRLGSRTPAAEGPDAQFFFGSPPVTIHSITPPPQAPLTAARGSGVFVELRDEAPIR